MKKLNSSTAQAISPVPTKKKELRILLKTHDLHRSQKIRRNLGVNYHLSLGSCSLMVSGAFCFTFSDPLCAFWDKGLMKSRCSDFSRPGNYGCPLSLKHALLSHASINRGLYYLVSHTSWRRLVRHKARMHQNPFSSSLWPPSTL